MARPLRLELTGAVYHVIVRGNERRAIFRDDHDRNIYLDRLAQCRARFQFHLLGYCLMSNHVHLAVQRGPVPLSRIMRNLQSFYAQRFNFRHQRTGHLFQGRYKAFLVQDERYLFALLRYIHLNPVRARVSDRPEAYPWSSDRSYRSGKPPEWLDAALVLRRLPAAQDEALSAYRKLMASPDEQSFEDVPTFAAPVKGDRQFAEDTMAKAGETGRFPSGWTPQSLAESVARVRGLTLEHLKKPGKSRQDSEVRLSAALLGREFGFSIASMAKCFGREESTFNRGVKLLELRICKDQALRAHFESLASAIRARDQITGIHDLTPEARQKHVPSESAGATRFPAKPRPKCPRNMPPPSKSLQGAASRRQAGPCRVPA